MVRNIIFGLGIIVIVGALAIVFINRTKKGKSTPEENRFQKNVLLSGLDEPMELAVLPNGNILFVERKGAIKLFENKQNQVTQLAKLNVFHDLEDGLLGLTLDPDFITNEFIYLFYSPPGEKPIQRVSRFKLTGSSGFDQASEKILIEIPTQRKECCHSAGSLAFGPDKTLYISVGDNTNPHNPGYYNSIDERSGREFWDAQRTAANTHDFRGKILRIKPEADGTYSIPDGNLFPSDGSQGKPEIFAMGCRNPYRIAVDQKTSYLYWGDVGQNTEDNPSRGPISYDEFHQARHAGFFGWPYFAGDNQPYTDFDFETEKIGPFFDPQRLVNESKNNTGNKVLPPAQPAFIWYSYDTSSRFQHLGTGGKSPVIGPVYYDDLYDKKPAWVENSRKFPKHYDGKLFIAEWMRDWINVVTMDKEGNLIGIEKFMPSTKFDHPIELEFGPDGALYMLEYGTFWFSQNKDARLVRIDYNEGNRAPVAIIDADNTTGAAPLSVTFSASRSYDYDKKDELDFLWVTDEKAGTQASGKTTQYTFTQPGTYKVTLKVIDPQGQSSTADIEVRVGNEMAEIGLEAKGNKSFYWPGKPFQYEVKVRDKEDGTLGAGIPADEVTVILNYTKDYADLQKALQSDDAGPIQFFGGMELINQSDCKACHHQQETSIGPSYEKIAVRYKDDPDAANILSEKIIKGASGNWGETAMSAHPQLTTEETAEMVKYILSLGRQDSNSQLPLKGNFVPGKDSTGTYVLQVAYRDHGGDSIGPLTAQQNFVIRNSKLKAVNCDDDKDVSKVNDEVVKFTKSGAYIAFAEIDLSQLKSVTYEVSSSVSGKIELHLDAVTGPVISAAAFDAEKRNPETDATKKNVPLKTTKSNLQPVFGTHDIYFVYKDTGEVKAEIWNTLDLWHISFD
ncbi:MAG: PQQ-dependent sugar dehydrogenase [Cyclobacteriaceae bacterium]